MSNNSGDSFFARHFGLILFIILAIGFASAKFGDPMRICAHGKCEPYERR